MAIFQNYKTKDSPRIPAAFFQFFHGSNIQPCEALWRAYQAWLARHQRESFLGFKNACLDKMEKAQAILDAWPNPFANAKKGQFYEISFSFPYYVDACHFFDLEKAGLVYVPSEKGGVIKGTPEAAGNFEILIVCRWAGWTQGLPLIRRPLPFVVNADPRDLWQDIPSDPEGEYWRPDCEFAINNTEDCLLLGASRRGRSHAHKGLPRDDAFSLDVWDGWRLLAVADGAGSAQFSRRGAELACQTGLAICQERLALAPDLDEIFANMPGEEWQNQAKKIAYGILPHAAFEVYKAIRREAELLERDSREYATTLLMCLAKKFEKGWAVLSFQIGDGAMSLLGPDNCQLLCLPDEGEYGGQTRFATMGEIFEGAELMRRIGVYFTEKLEGLLLLTDGISDCRFGSQEMLENCAKWHGLWQELKSLAYGEEPERAFLEWLNFWERGSHDDRTAAMLIVEE